MTTPAPAIADDVLHAYVDGQLDPARVPEVLEWLRAHPDDALRVAQWQLQRHELRRLHRSLDMGPAPAALARSVLRARRWRWAQGVAAAALLTLGVAGGWWQGSQRHASAPLAAAPFVHDAVVAHAVFVPEVRHPVEVAASDEAHLVQWLSRRLGAPLRVPSLQQQGFRLLGGRLLPGASGPRAQFMYEDAQARRLTLYVTVFDEGRAPAETAFRSLRDGALESFYWVDGRFGYALSGALPTSTLMALARETHRQLAR